MHTGMHYSQPYFLLFDLVFGKRPRQVESEDDAAMTAVPVSAAPLAQARKQDKLQA